MNTIKQWLSKVSRTVSFVWIFTEAWEPTAKERTVQTISNTEEEDWKGVTVDHWLYEYILA
jgi:hypothetical protein